MLTIAIPAHNEAPTVGVLLWRVRTVFQDYPREYEVLVYNDGSTDGTAEVLEPYAKALPLTVLGGATPVGYAGAVNALLREATRRTRYPRRDAVILMQGDFTDLPEHIPELVRRFEGGADVVLTERTADQVMPQTERRLRKMLRWGRPLMGAIGANDAFGTYRLMRLSIIRDVLKTRGDAPIITRDGWAGNLELFHATSGAARRVESVALATRFDLRPRPSRRRPFADAVAIVRAARTMRGATPPPPQPPQTAPA